MAEHAVRARVIIKIDPCPDPGTGLHAIGLALQVNVFVLEAAPQPLDKDIVHPAASAIHRDFDLCPCQSAEFFDVDVDHLARECLLIADDVDLGVEC
jgi:hypothetical protein